MRSQEDSVLHSSGVNSSMNKTNTVDVVCIEGRIQDIPPQPRVLGSNRKKASQTIYTPKRMENSNNKSIQQLQIQNFSKIYSPYNKNSNNNYHSMSERNNIGISQNFYEYCTKQITNISQNNNILQKQIEEIKQNIGLQQIKTKQLQSEKQRTKQRKQSLLLKKILQKQKIRELENKIQNQKKNFQNNTHTIVKVHTANSNVSRLNQMMRLYNQKTHRNSNELKEISILTIQNEKLETVKKENEILNADIVSLMNKCQQLQISAVNKPSIVLNHLWDVKKIQYDNLLVMLKNMDVLI